MKAISLNQAEDINIKDISEPDCKDNEVKIKVEAAGICGSDVAAYEGKNPLITYPRIIGHEIAGEVVETGAEVGESAVGDRVVLEPYLYCGECYPCSLGRTNSCENLQVLGVHVDGGMSDYFCHPAQLVHQVPATISKEKMPLLEPLVVALHAVHRLQVKEGEHVVIMGAGPIGNLSAQVVMAEKGIPIVVDLLDERLEIAQNIGVPYIINPEKEDAVNRVQDITGGRMAECVVEATGAAAAIKSTLDLVSFAGRIALVGWPSREISLPTRMFTLKELDVLGSRVSVGEFPTAVELVEQGEIDLEVLLSKVVPFEELPEAVVELAQNPEDYLKIVGIKE